MVQTKNENKQKIILEFTPEEIRLLAYGAVTNDLKKRMMEIAYYIDDIERVITNHKEKEQEKKQPVEKIINCPTCGKPIAMIGTEKIKT